MATITCGACGKMTDNKYSFCLNCYEDFEKLETDEDIDTIKTEEVETDETEENNYYIELLEKNNKKLENEKKELEEKIKLKNEELNQEKVRHEKELKDIIVNENRFLKDKLNSIEINNDKFLKEEIDKLQEQNSSLKNEILELNNMLDIEKERYKKLENKVSEETKIKYSIIRQQVKKLLLEIVSISRYILAIIIITGACVELSNNILLSLKLFIFALSLCPFVYKRLWLKVKQSLKNRVVLQITLPLVLFLISFVALG